MEEEAPFPLRCTKVDIGVVINSREIGVEHRHEKRQNKIIVAENIETTNE